MTQKELAEQADVKQQTISAIERGTIENITTRTYKNLRNVLGDEFDILEGVETDRKKNIESIRGVFE